MDHLEQPPEHACTLLTLPRRKKSKVSSYVISQDLDNLKRDTDDCLAKVRGRGEAGQGTARARGAWARELS